MALLIYLKSMTCWILWPRKHPQGGDSLPCQARAQFAGVLAVRALRLRCAGEGANGLVMHTLRFRNVSARGGGID